MSRLVTSLVASILSVMPLIADEPGCEKRVSLLITECFEQAEVADKMQEESRDRIDSTRNETMSGTKKRPTIIPGTKAHKELCDLSPEYVPAILRALADPSSNPKLNHCFYLSTALRSVTRATPSDFKHDGQYFYPPDLEQWQKWWEEREQVPERFEAAYKAFLKAEEADKGVVSVARTTFDKKTGQTKTVTELTDFGKAVANLRRFGLDAIPECVERFEAKDYRLRFLFEELTGMCYGITEVNTEASVCGQYIKWWRNKDENAQAMRYQMPNLDAGAKKK
jgi:hypothetical protein